jgi:hypothetical protein
LNDFVYNTIKNDKLNFELIKSDNDQRNNDSLISNVNHLEKKRKQSKITNKY